MAVSVGKFIVAGGGIGGLSVAKSLSEGGQEVVVLEQAETFSEVGAGIQLGPNGMRAIEALGIAKQVHERAWRPSALVMRDGYTGDEIVRLPIDDSFEARYKAPYCVVHRADVLGALLSACEAHPNVELRTKSRVRDFESTDNGVTVRLESGEEITGDALIGADGLRSAVREKIIGDGVPHKPRHVVYRGVVPKEVVPKQLWAPEVHMWCGDGADFVHYPVRSGEAFNLVVTFRSPVELEPDDITGSFDDMIAPYAGFADEIQELLKFQPHDRRWLVTDRDPIANWSQGRVTLLGDAAHPMLQYMAQGAAQALEDSIQLGEELASGSSIEGAFSSYAEKRYLRTARVQLSARQFIEVCQADPIFGAVRNAYFANRPVEKVMESLDWLYSPDPGVRFA